MGAACDVRFRVQACSQSVHSPGVLSRWSQRIAGSGLRGLNGSPPDGPQVVWGRILDKRHWGFRLLAGSPPPFLLGGGVTEPPGEERALF